MKTVFLLVIFVAFVVGSDDDLMSYAGPTMGCVNECYTPEKCKSFVDCSVKSCAPCSAMSEADLDPFIKVKCVDDNVLNGACSWLNCTGNSVCTECISTCEGPKVYVDEYEIDYTGLPTLPCVEQCYHQTLCEPYVTCYEPLCPVCDGLSDVYQRTNCIFGNLSDGVCKRDAKCEAFRDKKCDGCIIMCESKQEDILRINTCTETCLMSNPDSKIACEKECVNRPRLVDEPPRHCVKKCYTPGKCEAYYDCRWSECSICKNETTPYGKVGCVTDAIYDGNCTMSSKCELHKTRACVGCVNDCEAEVTRMINRLDCRRGCAKKPAGTRKSCRDNCLKST